MTDELAFLKRCYQNLPHPLNARGLAIFLALADKRGPILFGDLRKEMGLRAPVITRTVDTLTRSGLVERKRSLQDGRTCYLSVTDAGRAKAHAILGDTRSRLAA